MQEIVAGFRRRVNAMLRGELNALSREREKNRYINNCSQGSGLLEAF
jgi:hypothetical protein